MLGENAEKLVCDDCNKHFGWITNDGESLDRWCLRCGLKKVK